MSKFPNERSTPTILPQNESMLRRVIETIPSGIVIFDDEGNIVLNNSELERLFGYNPGELIGKSVENLVPDGLRSAYRSHRQSYQQRPEKRQLVGRHLAGLRKDGSEIPVEIGLNPVGTEDRPLVVASVVDATVRKKQEDRLMTVVESVPAGIVLVDRSGTVILCNHETEKMFKYGRGELTGQKVEALVPQRHRAQHPTFRHGFTRHPLKRQMGAGRDLTGVRRDGVEFPVEIGLNPIQIDDQDFVLASIVDISERKKSEDEFFRIHEEVQRRSQEMEQFVYTVSHDLKSPLVTSMSFLAFLKEDMQEGNVEAVAESIKCLERAHRRMQQLIDDLLHLSRVGSMELQLQNVDVQDLVQTVVQSLAEELRKKHLTVELAGDLPVVVADYRRVQQIIENLIINAIKYGVSGRDPRVRIFAKETESDVRYCIKDNGPGIQKQFHEKIFGLFQRLDNSEEGTGVGLTIVSRAMQRHGGKVWVQSEPGHGCEFWLSFPKRPLIES